MTSFHPPAPQEPDPQPHVDSEPPHMGSAPPPTAPPPTASPLYAAPQLTASAVFQYPASNLHALLRAVIGGVLMVAAVVAGTFGGQFPHNAPMESVMNGGLIILFVVAGIMLFMFAAHTAAVPSVATKPERVSPLAINALVFTSIGLIATILFAGLPAFYGSSLRYMSLNAGPFFLGFLWGTGFVMGTLALRATRKASRVCAILAVIFGLILVAVSVAAAVIYGLGLSD